MKTIGLFMMLFLATLIGSELQAQHTVFANADKIGIHGYDVVAYHTQHAAVRGSADFATKHGGVTYYFSSQDHLNAFKAGPSKYLPKYGGYCSLAMAMQGKEVPSDPRTFKLRDGELYLFYNDFYEGKPFNTIIMWNGDEKGFLDKAEKNWKKRS